MISLSFSAMSFSSFVISRVQGISLVHFSDQREPFSWDTVGGSVTKTAQVQLSEGLHSSTFRINVGEGGGGGGGGGEGNGGGGGGGGV